MLYCPNCSAYLHDEKAGFCEKCGFDLSLYREKEHVETEMEKREAVPDLTTYDRSRPCGKCGSPTRKIDREFDISVEGKRIPVHGLRLMGGDITKRAVTLYTFKIKGLECIEGHRFYREVSYKSRFLCPVCYDPMMTYGSSLLSCSRCNMHFPARDWPEPDPIAVLEKEGWERLE